MTPNIPLAAWEPDGDPTKPGVLVEVGNMVPTRRGFASDLGPGDYNGLVLPDKCYGGRLLPVNSINPAVMLATDSTLYYYGGSGSLVDRNRATPVYVAPADLTVAWRFEQFGEYTLAIQRDNPLQASADISTTDFSDVSGAPSAYTMCVASGFVMVANTVDVPADNTFRYFDAWHCSALGDHSDWTPSIATQCAQGRLLETPGPILRLFAYGPDVLAFKRGSLIRGRYVRNLADGIIWEWRVISSEVGIVGHDAVVQVGGVVYFMSLDGVYAFNGSSLRRVDSFPRLWWMRAQANSGTDDSLFMLTQAVYDPVRRVIRWHYVQDVTAQKTAPYMGGCLIYHVETDRWGHAEHACEWALNVPWTGSAALPDFNGYDGTAVEGTGPYAARNLAAYVDASTHVLRIYLSTATSSYFVTGDIGDDDMNTVGVRARLRFLRQPTSATVEHRYTQTLGGALTSGDTATLSDGKADFSHSARWHRLVVEMVGPFEATGFRFDGATAGRR